MNHELMWLALKDSITETILHSKLIGLDEKALAPYIGILNGMTSLEETVGPIKDNDLISLRKRIMEIQIHEKIALILNNE